MSTAREFTPSIPEQPRKKDSHEKRSTAPTDLMCRKLFGTIFKYIRRYSANPFEKDENGSYIIPNEAVALFLNEDIKEIRERDALINLLVAQEEETIDTKSTALHIGVYRFVKPSIKDLNDTYLGVDQTDDFIEALNNAITEHLARNSGKILNTNYKRGIFVLDFDALANGTGTTLEQRIEEIHKIATDLLIKELRGRIETCSTKIIELKNKLDRTKNEEENKKKENKIANTNKEIQAVQHLIELLKTDKHSIDIAFGFDPLKPNPEDAYMSIRNAECAANIASLRNGRQIHTERYDDEKFITELIKGVQLLEKFGVYDEDGKISKEWKLYFEIDEKTGFACMRERIINIYRSLNKFRTTKHYQDLSPEKKNDFNDKITKFGKYYNIINIVDVLKPFREPHFERYIENVKRLAALASQCKSALSTKSRNYKEMRNLLNKISLELEISPKDEETIQNRSPHQEAAITRTIRAMIKSLMRRTEQESPENKIITFMDRIGFGGFNQKMYENSVHQIIKGLGISREELSSTQGSEEKIKELAQKGATAINNNPIPYRKTILEIGDAGSLELRTNDKHTNNLFKGTATVNGDGGDETIAIFKKEDNPEIPGNITETRKQLLEFSNRLGIRIYAEETDLTFDRIRKPEEQLAPTEQTRKQIRKCIFGTFTRARRALDEIKDLNARGRNKIIYELT